jgi:carbon monoxide dehydrogenase subunit G
VKLEQSFEVAAPLERVWAALIDVEQVAPCLPGAAVTGRNDDGTYNGTFTIKIGPTTANYTGKLQMQDVDEGSHTATMKANGTDKRGQGGANAMITSTLHPEGDGTRVEVATDYHITGRLARFGRGGMIEDISKRLLGEFADRLQQALTGSGNGGAPSEAPAAEESAAPADESAAEAAGGSAAEAVEEATPPAAEEIRPDGAGEAAEPEAEAEASGAGTEASEAEASGAEADASEADAPAPEADPAAAAAPPSQHEFRAPPPAEPIQGLSLAGGVFVDRIKRNPAPFLVGFLLALLLLRRRRK